MTSRNNTASALTRAVKSSLPGVAIKVRSDDYTKAATVTGDPAQLIAAREYLAQDPRFYVTDIKTYKILPRAFYVMFSNQRP